MLETKDTNPMHFFESTDQYFKIKRKKGVEEYGQWMFNNGYNAALYECRIKVRELETKIQKLVEAFEKDVDVLKNELEQVKKERDRYKGEVEELCERLDEHTD